MTRPPGPPRMHAALALAVIAAGLAGVALARELAGRGPGALRPIFATVAGVAAVACLWAARGERAAGAWMLAALGVTLLICAAVALA